MKNWKRVLATAGILVLTTSGLVWAQRPYGGGPANFQIDPAKAQAFCQEVQPLWQREMQIKGELLTLWAKTPPDFNAILQKETERAKIRVEIHKKAYEMGLPYAPTGKRALKLRRLCGW
ncbi:MAG: hypothetical protein N3A56_03740 [Thermodesulfobacteriaceae bacterium]|nr:hypothetical protein [Thermodesulfobacteriaceae bacterium]